MNWVGVTVLSLLVCHAVGSTIRTGHERATYEKELSNLAHDLKGKHNAEYDHEAFLGKEEAHQFDQLTPEQSKEKLALLVDKIDTDNDGHVTEGELQAWIKYIQRRYITEDSERQWVNYDKQPGDTMTWSEYLEKTFPEGLEHEGTTSEETFSYKTMKERDQRRFKLADQDYNEQLTFSEYVNFLHPEDAPHMREIVVRETMEDIDKDKDGFISESEYIGDMWNEGGDEPNWVATEREHFSKWRDLNQDGKMDATEVQHWIMPDDYDHAIAESKHLIHEADDDRDGQLTKEEVLNSYDVFVGSQVTDFGEALSRSHDEF